MEREISAAPARTASSQTAVSPGVIVKKVFGVCLKHWYWFVITLTLAFACAFLYLQSTAPVYSRAASIMVKQSNESSMVAKELGISMPSTNLTNEIQLITSSVVAEEVVKRLNLDMDYFQDGPFYDRTIYGTELPFSVRFLEINDNDRLTFTADCNKDSTFVFKDWILNGRVQKEEPIAAHPGDTVQTLVGSMVVLPGTAIGRSGIHQLTVVRYDLNTAAQRVRINTAARLRSANTSIIDISCRDISRARADDVLNTLITVYNEQWMRTRNQQIVSTNEFIRERLAVIEQELGSVDKSISDFKSENLMLDVRQAGTQALSEATETEREETELSSRISQMRTTYEYIANLTDDSQQIPVYSNTASGTILQRIAEYNQLILQRNSHQSYSSAQNPLVVELNEQLASRRTGIVELMSAEIAINQERLNSLQSKRRQAQGKVAQNPRQENYLLSVERKQSVMESLYLFLLQKREENELSQAFTAYNTQLIEPTHGRWEPVQPVKSRIYLLALLFGLGLPIAAMFIKEILTTTVQDRDDVKSMQIPFAGAIPQNNKRKKKNKASDNKILVQEGSRDIMNEAFRVLRSNLEFVLGFDEIHKVIMLTSMDPGSGKTFISANLASVMSLKGHKVLAVDLDLRKASLSEYAQKPAHGISRYLNGKYEDYHDLIVRVDNFDILPCGTLPPNPAELLYSSRFQSFIEDVKQEYDFVILDCPPVEIVADAAIINRHVDLTIFVVRCGVLEKAMLPEIDQWYQDKQYINMVLLLNGADASGGRYGYHKYGYHKYGYGYGYYGSSK
jgi:capsular exopolysaccharide synthesis family protein